MEVTLRALGDAGLDELDSTRAYFLLISFTLGQAAYQTRGPIEGLEPLLLPSGAGRLVLLYGRPSFLSTIED
jgi:hypothetical protein